MKVCCLSDLHGHLQTELPAQDLLLLGGDYVPGGGLEKEIDWLNGPFDAWLRERKAPVIGVAGNHDWPFQLAPKRVAGLSWTYLKDSGTHWRDLKIYGSPWQPTFCNWAFNQDEAALRDIWAAIPAETDILLLHGPPHGYGDVAVDFDKLETLRSGDPVPRIHVGSPSLTERVLEVKPRLVVAGHIHSGNGIYKIGESVFVNASCVDEQYRPGQPIHVIELDDPRS